MLLYDLALVNNFWDIVIRIYELVGGFFHLDLFKHIDLIIEILNIVGDLDHTLLEFIVDIKAFVD